MDRTIQPGQAEKVEVDVSAPKRMEKFSKRFSILSNDREHAQVSLECVVKVLGADSIEPPSVMFGEIRSTAPSQTRTVTIKRGDGGPLDPKIVSATGTKVATELKEIQKGELYELHVTADPPWGNELRGVITLDPGVEKAQREIISFMGNVVPRLRAMPQSLLIPGKVETNLELKANLIWDEKPGKVVDATVTNPELKVRVDEQGNQPVLVLTVPGGFAPNASMYNIVLKTDDPDVPALVIPARVLQQPRYPVTSGPTTRPTTMPAVRSLTTAPTTRPMPRPPTAGPVGPPPATAPAVSPAAVGPAARPPVAPPAGPASRPGAEDAKTQPRSRP